MTGPAAAQPDSITILAIARDSPQKEICVGPGRTPRNAVIWAILS